MSRRRLPGRAPFAAWLVAGAAVAAGCSGGPQLQAPKDPAGRKYLEGLQQVRSGNHLEAAQTFVDVVKMPAYLAATAPARLRLGDALAAQGKYEEAIEVFEGYLQRHAGSRDVAYAAWRVAECHAQLVPEDFWLMPPVREMDLSSADKARYHLERFVRAHPTAPWVGRALQLRDQMIALELAQHRYVVGFYRDRHEPLGVAWRSHEMMRRFPLHAHTLADYAALAEAYDALQWRRRARDLYRLIARRWPSAPQAAPAAQRAADLDADMARRRAAGEAAAEMPVEPPPTAQIEPETFEGQVREEG